MTRLVSSRYTRILIWVIAIPYIVRDLKCFRREEEKTACFSPQEKEEKLKDKEKLQYFASINKFFLRFRLQVRDSNEKVFRMRFLDGIQVVFNEHRTRTRRISLDDGDWRDLLERPIYSGSKNQHMMPMSGVFNWKREIFKVSAFLLHLHLRMCVNDIYSLLDG